MQPETDAAAQPSKKAPKGPIMHKLRSILHWRHRGQSLVETALVLPFMLVLIAGVVEVSNLVITKNRIETAARAAARFASNGGVEVQTVALNAVTDTLDLSSGVWDIWLIDATLNANGTDFQSWTADGDTTDALPNTPIYGLQQTTAYTDVVSIIGNDCIRDPDPIDMTDPGANRCIRDQVYAELLAAIPGLPSNPTPSDLAGLQVVGVYIAHDIDSILGLNVIPALANVLSVQGFSIMRMASTTSQDGTLGCLTAMPIAFDRTIRSLTGSTYPDASLFSYPATPPPYAIFSNNVPGHEPGKDAREGDIFLLDGTSLRLAFLKWNKGIADSPTTLANSLTSPGDVSDYLDHGDPGIPAGTYSHVVRGFVDVGNALDGTMHIGNRVAANLAGSIGSVTAQLNNHIDSGRNLRLIALPESGGAPQFLPDGTPFHTIDGFAVFRLHGYSISGNWILAEFINWDESCGQ